MKQALRAFSILAMFLIAVPLHAQTGCANSPAVPDGSAGSAGCVGRLGLAASGAEPTNEVRDSLQLYRTLGGDSGFLWRPPQSLGCSRKAGSCGFDRSHHFED